MKEWVDKNCVTYKNIIALQGVFCQFGKGGFPFNLKVVDKNFGEMTKSVYKIEE